MRFQWIIIEVVATRIKYKVRLYHNMKRRLQILINIISPKVRVTIILMILKNPDTKRLKDSRYHLIDGAIIRFSLENKCPKFQGRYRNNLDLHSEIVIRDLKLREDKALILLLKIPWIQLVEDNQQVVEERDHQDIQLVNQGLIRKEYLRDITNNTLILTLISKK